MRALSALLALPLALGACTAERPRLVSPDILFVATPELVGVEVAMRSGTGRPGGRRSAGASRSTGKRAGCCHAEAVVKTSLAERTIWPTSRQNLPSRLDFWHTRPAGTPG